MTKKALRAALAPCISAGLLWFVLRDVDSVAALARLRAADPAWILASLLLSALVPAWVGRARRRRPALPGRWPGDVTCTYADVSALHALTGYRARTTLAEGLGHFTAWHRGWRGG